MTLTEEQAAIIQSKGNIKINAVAGSGKTTTVIAYAKAKPATSRILYLAFNKSVKLEAIKKFAEIGLTNVTVETAHSLAFKYIVYRSNYKVRPQGYKTNEIAELLSLKATGEKHAEYIIANHINKMIAYFCNSDKHKVQELNYLDIVADPVARTFVAANYQYIEKQARIVLGKMDNAEIEITHDFYLKKFQLANPQLGYDYILFDEGQDASPAMLAIFLQQAATKVIVGDTHQQIYGWRYAVNSLEKADFTTYHLSTSFRFAQPIADLAVDVLQWKEQLTTHKPVTINGKGKSKTKATVAVIARTNLGLLLKAIEYVTEKKDIKHIYFEGNINSYTYADEGASLYDVLNLQNGKRDLIRDNLIKAMKDIEELKEYIEKTEDMQLGMMVEIVKEYGNEIPSIIKAIKDKHLPNDEKEKADIIFSTVHRCKGMEYDIIHLANDFINEEKLEKTLADTKKEALNTTKLNEEINLLYVAITRAKHSLHIPEALMPIDFPPATNIYVIPKISAEDKQKAKAQNTKKPPYIASTKGKTYSVELVREKHNGAYQPWTAELDAELTAMFCKGKNITDMIKHFKRTKGAIVARIKKLQLAENYG
ncbi:UvrD-helicase domain-containing protein [Parasediminibacterium paludis]|uniref:DNA 3'-5' helicase n=1 Tax=Parasediminibacterium paludis TaxID=908966 RepID=A0ABV8PTP6_9BACT